MEDEPEDRVGIRVRLRVLLERHLVPAAARVVEPRLAFHRLDRRADPDGVQVALHPLDDVAVRSAVDVGDAHVDAVGVTGFRQQLSSALRVVRVGLDGGVEGPRVFAQGGGCHVALTRHHRFHQRLLIDGVRDGLAEQDVVYERRDVT